MSSEATHEFTERMKADQAFRQRVLTAPDPDARLAMIQAEGFACTTEDLASFDALVADDDLEHVVAGNGCAPWDPNYTPFGPTTIR